MECVVHDFIDWRNQARRLLAARVLPADVAFVGPNASSDLFASGCSGTFNETATALTAASSPSLSIPKEFIQRAHWVAHHSSAQRWQVLYVLAWRLIYEDKRLLLNPIDPEVKSFNQWFKAVTRDYHKMKAFVRFQAISDFSGDDKTFAQPHIIEPESLHGKQRKKKEKGMADLARALEASADDEHFIAWFEPEHFVLPLAANFFAKRFSSMSWSVLTPHECAHWYQKKLFYTEGATRPPLPEDQTEALWLQYYGSIFNPARVKVKAMQSEMPKKYWKNLPEAQLIKSLLQRATCRVDKMVDCQ